jgi:hypothetical protein
VAQQLDQRHNLQQHQRRIEAAAQANGGLRAVGNLVVCLFVALTCLMAVHALHGEQRQMEQLQQLR